MQDPPNEKWLLDRKGVLRYAVENEIFICDLCLSTWEKSDRGKDIRHYQHVARILRERDVLGYTLGVMASTHGWTAAELARKLEQRAIDIWPDRGEPPLSNDVLSRLYRRFINSVKKKN